MFSLDASTQISHTGPPEQGLAIFEFESHPPRAFPQKEQKNNVHFAPPSFFLRQTLSKLCVPGVGKKEEAWVGGPAEKKKNKNLSLSF